MQNFFELFNLPVQFEVDETALDIAYRNIQKLVHPDRFVTATEAEKRAAVQYASLANDAYQTLKDPLKRAMHLCALNGYVMGESNHVDMDPMFLMEQMEWREQLEKAQDDKDSNALLALSNQQKKLCQEQLVSVKTQLDRHHFDEAIQEINKLMFFERLGIEIYRAFEQIAHAN